MAQILRMNHRRFEIPAIAFQIFFPHLSGVKYVNFRFAVFDLPGKRRGQIGLKLFFRLALEMKLRSYLSLPVMATKARYRDQGAAICLRKRRCISRLQYSPVWIKL